MGNVAKTLADGKFYGSLLNGDYFESFCSARYVDVGRLLFTFSNTAHPVCEIKYGWFEGHGDTLCKSIAF